VAGTGFREGPIPRLSVEWLEAAADGTPEWRLACALSSAAAAYDRHGRPLDHVRRHWLPLDSRGSRYRQTEGRIVRDVRVVATGRDAAVDCGAVVERRLIEAAQSGDRHLPLVAAPGAGAQPPDLAGLINGQVDVARTVILARALMAVRWDAAVVSVDDRTAGRAWPDESWIAIRLACLAGPLDDQRDTPVDEAIVRRLRVGDAASAVAIAVRRLGAAGLRPPIRVGGADAAMARLWAAALAFPIGARTARAMARRFESRPKEIR